MRCNQYCSTFTIKLLIYNDIVILISYDHRIDAGLGYLLILYRRNCLQSDDESLGRKRKKKYMTRHNIIILH